jgi:hypothetical protein
MIHGNRECLEWNVRFSGEVDFGGKFCVGGEGFSDLLDLEMWVFVECNFVILHDETLSSWVHRLRKMEYSIPTIVHLVMGCYICDRWFGNLWT